MAQDIAKGCRTETDFINGYVAARGAEIGVPDEGKSNQTRPPEQAKSACGKQCRAA